MRKESYTYVCIYNDDKGIYMQHFSLEPFKAVRASFSLFKWIATELNTSLLHGHYSV